jgi:hypothetical protein
MVCHGDELLVPPVVSRLVATDQEDGDAPWVERVEDPIGASTVLDLNSRMWPWREVSTPEL